MRLRTISTGAAVVAAMSVGVAGFAGAAGAATPGASHPKAAARVAAIEAIATSGTLPASFDCSTAATKLAKITQVTDKINARIPVAQAREAKATANGNTAVADRISSRIAKAQTFETDLGTVASLITAKCG